MSSLVTRWLDPQLSQPVAELRRLLISRKAAASLAERPNLRRFRSFRSHPVAKTRKHMKKKKKVQQFVRTRV
jgi:hypothetical protein